MSDFIFEMCCRVETWLEEGSDGFLVEALLDLAEEEWVTVTELHDHSDHLAIKCRSGSWQTNESELLCRREALLAVRRTETPVMTLPSAMFEGSLIDPDVE